MKAKQAIRLQKRLLQFNNLVFSYGSVTSPTYSSSFKGSTTSYTNALHGGYYPNFGDWGKLEVSEFEATLVFDFNPLGCGEEYTRYMRFIKRELARPGKLWAVQGGTEIVWANARVISINEVEDDDTTNTLTLSVQFELIDGFWVMASQSRTFIAEYNVADFKDYDENYCFSLSDMTGGCTSNGNNCLPCNKVEQEVNYPNDIAYRALCEFTREELLKMFSVSCPSSYAIKYDCALEAERFCYDVAWGEKKRLKKGSIGYNNSTEYNYCSRTDIPTELVRVTLIGSFNNPTITINGRTISIEGSFDNQAITIGEGLEIYMSTNPKDPYSNTVSLINQAKFDGVPYFQMKPGLNEIKVTGNLYNINSFIYLKPVELSF